MIIMSIFGGLGNQMYQYALGRKLSLVHNTELKLDITWFKQNNSYTKRSFGLPFFNINQNIANEREVSHFKNNKTIYYYLNKLFFKGNYIYFNEKEYYFNESVFKLSGNIYLEGYWASEKYFIDIKDYLLIDFSLKKELIVYNLDLINKIQNSNSISIHFRRGDYLNDASQSHGALALDYYYNAINLINKQIENPLFIIFSDDIGWVKSNFKIEFNAIFIDSTKLPNEDIYLMSQCRHNIIANSSFSWWGAWLNNNPGKIVIAPEVLYKDDKLNILMKESIPQSWKRI